MKVLHLLDHSVPLHSGYSFRTLALLQEQRKLGWDVMALTSSKHYGASAAVERVEGFEFYRTPVRQTGLRKLPVLDQLAVITDTQRRLEEVVLLTSPDLIHAHSPCLNGIAAIRAGRKLGLPVVYEMRASWEDAAVDHGSTTQGSLRYRLSRSMESWVLKRADAVTTICEGLRQDILSRGVDAARVTVIANGVNVDDFKMSPSRDTALQLRLGLQDSVVIGFLGSFYGYEGLDLLLDALPAILKFEPSAKLLLVGGGPEQHALELQAARLGLVDQVVMPGRVPHGDVAKYYSVVDLLAFPRKSMRLTETVTPLKPLEAMAQGKLLIASNVGGHRELIKDGATGFLFDPDSSVALAGAVRRVLAAKSQWPAMREEGRRFVENERSWQRSAAFYPSVYQSAQREAQAH